MELPVSGESTISAKLKETSTSSGQLILSPQSILKNIRPKNMKRLIFADLNINSIRNKFDSLVTVAKENIDVFFISEINLPPLFRWLNSLLKGMPHLID